MTVKKVLQNVVLLFVVFSACPALAEDEQDITIYGGKAAHLYSIEKVKLVVQDDVHDGCLPRPSSLKRSAEVALRRNGISVVDEGEPSIPTAVINPLGGESRKNSCAVAFNMWLNMPRLVFIPDAQKVDGIHSTIINVREHVYITLLTGLKSDMQNRLEESAEEGADNLFIAIDRARDKIKEKWPRLWEASQKEQ